MANADDAVAAQGDDVLVTILVDVDNDDVLDPDVCRAHLEGLIGRIGEEQEPARGGAEQDLDVVLRGPGEDVICATTIGVGQVEMTDANPGVYSSFNGCYAVSEFNVGADLSTTSNCATWMGYEQTDAVFCGEAEKREE